MHWKIACFGTIAQSDKSNTNPLLEIYSAKYLALSKHCAFIIGQREGWRRGRLVAYRSWRPGLDSWRPHIFPLQPFIPSAAFSSGPRLFFCVYLPVQLLSFFTRVYKLCQANNRSFSIQSPSLFSQMEPDINGKFMTCGFPKTIQNYVRYYLSNEVRIILFFVFAAELTGETIERSLFIVAIAFVLRL